MLSWSHFISS